MSNKPSRTPNRTKEFWLHHIEQWHSSGLSKAAYCQQNNLSAGNFYNWFSKESLSDDRKSHSKSTMPLKFLPVTVAKTVAQASTVSLYSHGRTFGFPAELSADDIERWLKVIDRQHV